MSRVVIVGPGSVAGFLGVQLARTGAEVLFCRRRMITSYVVHSPDKRCAGSVEVDCVVRPDAVTEAWDAPDWLIVGVKTHQLESAAGWFARLAANCGTVVSIQNGVDSARRLREIICGQVVLPVLAYCGAETTGPGCIRHSGRSLLVTEQSTVGSAFRCLFGGTAVDVDLAPDIGSAIWRKAIVNSAVNGVTALSRRRLDVVRDPAVAAVAYALMRECWCVAVAYGAVITEDELNVLATEVLSRASKTATTSMYQDWMAGASTEHDAIYGAIARMGEERGIDTPLHRAIDALLSAGSPDASREDHP